MHSNNQTKFTMDNYPQKTCSIDRLITHPNSIAAAKAGVKTQQRRDGVYGWPGEEFQLDGRTFVITDLTRDRLGDMTEDDAKAEGYPSLAQYKDIILKMHAGMTWNEEHLVWVHKLSAK
jgi:N4-acetylcytidine amidohydrolase